MPGQRPCPLMKAVHKGHIQCKGVLTGAPLRVIAAADPQQPRSAPARHAAMHPTVQQASVRRACRSPRVCVNEALPPQAAQLLVHLGDGPVGADGGHLAQPPVVLQHGGHLGFEVLETRGQGQGTPERARRVTDVPYGVAGVGLGAWTAATARMVL